MTLRVALFFLAFFFFRSSFFSPLNLIRSEPQDRFFLFFLGLVYPIALRLAPLSTVCLACLAVRPSCVGSSDILVWISWTGPGRSCGYLVPGVDVCAFLGG